MQAALEASGFATLNLDYASRRNPLEMLADDIHSAIAGFATGVDGSLHFVCHSMGGRRTRCMHARRTRAADHGSRFNTLDPALDTGPGYGSRPSAAASRGRTSYPIISATRPIALRSINSRIARA